MSSASLIIRARDEAGRLGELLAALAAQRDSVVAEVIVVDNGSRDGTAAVARQGGATVVELARERFSFGRALNLGAAEAGGELLVALSADALPPDPEWLARLAAVFEDPRVACASGEIRGPDGQFLNGRVLQDLELARRWPRWGYSNAAGAVRTELWRERPFREDLTGCEDKEWALHWLAAGRRCVIDPALAVRHDHTRDPLAAVFRRGRREEAGYAAFLELGRLGPRELVREWWSDPGWHASPPRARLSPRRAAWLLGRYAGRRRP